MELRRGTMTLPASEDKAKRWGVWCSWGDRPSECGCWLGGDSPTLFYSRDEAMDHARVVRQTAQFHCEVREYTGTPAAVSVSATGFCHVSDGAPAAPSSKNIASVGVRIDRWDVTRNSNIQDVLDLTLNGAVLAEALESLREVLSKGVGYVRLVAHSSVPIPETDTQPPIDVEQTVIGLMRSEGCGNLARLLFNSDPDIRALDLGDVSGESSNPYRVDAAARAWERGHPLRAKYEEMVKRVVEKLGKP